MRKSRFSIIVALVIVMVFAFSNTNAYAKSRKSISSKSSKKSVSTKKTSKTKSSRKKKTIKKSTRKAPRRVKRTSLKLASRGGFIASVRGSGSTLGSADANKLIAAAKQYMGVRYVYGGTTPSGFDCSGFVKYVFDKYDISLSHATTVMANQGVLVPRSELQKGDLVFFQTYRPGPSHVGIYIGGGNFIHASSSDGVRISNLSEAYYASRYLGATRVIK